MAILYGTTGDGTTLPVLVDQFGNLLAKGIEGPEGPPGPPGIGQLPPDPFEGAILGWEDGELSWLGAPVPVPTGTYGPFIYSDTEGTLTVPQDVGLLVNGQQLLMTDKEGNLTTVLVETSEITNVDGNVLSFVDNSNFDLFYEGQVVQPGVGILNISGSTTPPKITVTGGSWYALPPAGDGTGDLGDGRYEPSQEWSTQLTATDDWLDGGGPDVAFDGDINSNSYTNSGSITFDASNLDINIASTIRTRHYGGRQAIVTTNTGAVALISPDDSGFNWTNQGAISGKLISIVITGVQTDSPNLAAVEIDGKLLTNSSIPGGRGSTKISKNESGVGSVSVATGNTIVLRNNNREWIDDYYVTAPEQRIAARKVGVSAIRRKTN